MMLGWLILAAIGALSLAAVLLAWRRGGRWDALSIGAALVGFHIVGVILIDRAGRSDFSLMLMLMAGWLLFSVLGPMAIIVTYLTTRRTIS